MDIQIDRSIDRSIDRCMCPQHMLGSALFRLVLRTFFRCIGAKDRSCGNATECRLTFPSAQRREERERERDLRIAANTSVCGTKGPVLRFTVHQPEHDQSKPLVSNKEKVRSAVAAGGMRMMKAHAKCKVQSAKSAPSTAVTTSKR